MRALEKLVFDNQSLRKLPIDKELRNFVRQVPNAWFSLVSPEPIESPRLVSASKSALELLDINFDEAKRGEFAEYFGGCKLLPGSQTAAHCYCGHQFGYFSGQLGDGAAMYLGEVINQRNERWEIQLKGAGMTPYSRSADGRKVLRSSIREYLCSELISHLGIATTRAGSIVTSDTRVVRDLYYTGNPIQERASVVLRIAPSFIRFGSFEIFKDCDEVSEREGPSAGNTEMQKQCMDFICDYFPLHKDQGYFAVYKEIVRRTAELVADWQCVGWCHGVLNTDNMSILGLTIDYGPYGFLESYDDHYICNGSDHNGRYSYSSQPEICKWNCVKLAEAWAPILPLEESAKWCNSTWDDLYNTAYQSKMKRKIGILSGDIKDLSKQLVDCMARTGIDFTLTYRALIKFAELFDKMGDTEIENFIETNLLTIAPSPALMASQITKKMSRLQPQIPLQQLNALSKLAESDPELLCRQFGIPIAALPKIKKELEEEAETHRKRAALLELRKLYGNEGGKGFIEESKVQWLQFLRKYRQFLCNEDQAASLSVMRSSNPTFILRNWVAQEAIAAAEKGDYSVVQNVLEMCCDPYNVKWETSDFARPNSTWSFDLCVTCSS